MVVRAGGGGGVDVLIRARAAGEEKKYFLVEIFSNMRYYGSTFYPTFLNPDTEIQFEG